MFSDSSASRDDALNTEGFGKEGKRRKECGNQNLDLKITHIREFYPLPLVVKQS